MRSLSFPEPMLLGKVDYEVRFPKSNELGIYPLIERGESWSVPGGAILKSRNAQSFRSVTITLDPEMNPVSFTLQGTLDIDPYAHKRFRNHYELRVFEGQQLLMQKAFSLQRDTQEYRLKAMSSDVVRFRTGEPIDFVDVPRTAQYHVILEETSKPEMTVTDMALELRRNAVGPNNPLTLLVILLIMLSGLFVFLSMIYDFRARLPKCPATSDDGWETKGL